MLIVNTLDRLVVVISSSFEIYSANLLRKFLHYRKTIKPGEKLPDTAQLLIPASQNEFHDKQNNVMHVYRRGSAALESIMKNKKFDLLTMVRMTMQYGTVDTNRKYGRGRILNFGVKCKDNCIDNAEFCGGHFKEEMEKHATSTEVNAFLYSLTAIMQIVWDCMKRMAYYANQFDLANDSSRFKVTKLIRHFLQNDGQFRVPFHFDAPFEWITLSILLIWPNLTGCKDHKDKKNCRFLSYGRTGCANFIVIDIKGNIYLFQVLLNFRASIEQAKFKYWKHVEKSVEQFKNYKTMLSKAYHKTFVTDYTGTRSSMSFLNDAFDMNDMFLDNHLPYREENISEPNTESDPIHYPRIAPLKTLRLPIGLSRPLSMSCYLAPMFHQRKILKFDQAVELAFMASFTNTPLRFHHIVTNMTKKDLEDSNNHPVLFYLKKSKELFGTYQGGTDNRYGPCGHSMEEMEKLIGNAEVLDQIMNHLLVYIQWIDSNVGKEKAADIPIESIQAELQKLTENVKKVIKERAGGTTIKNLEFALFRAQIFTTLISGLQLVLPGPHLMQMMVPLGEQASAHQLKFATSHEQNQEAMTAVVNGDLSNSRTVKSYFLEMPFDCFNEAMELISIQMLFKEYLRNNIEGGLCEGRDGRVCIKMCHLVKGSSLHDLDSTGTARYKLFAKNSWIAIGRYPRHLFNSKLGFKFDEWDDDKLVECIVEGA